MPSSDFVWDAESTAERDRFDDLEYNWCCQMRPRHVRSSTAPQPFIRKSWVLFSQFATFLIPDWALIHMGGITNPETRTAWREKVTLCLIMAVVAMCQIFTIEWLPKLTCTPELLDFTRFTVARTENSPYLIVQGRIVSINQVNDPKIPPEMKDDVNQLVETLKHYAGYDASSLFPQFLDLREKNPDGTFVSPVLERIIANKTAAQEYLTKAMTYYGLYEVENDPSNVTGCSLPKNLTDVQKVYEGTSLCFYGVRIRAVLDLLTVGVLRVNDTETPLSGFPYYVLVGQNVYNLTDLIQFGNIPQDGELQDPSTITSTATITTTTEIMDPNMTSTLMTVTTSTPVPLVNQTVLVPETFFHLSDLRFLLSNNGKDIENLLDATQAQNIPLFLDLFYYAGHLPIPLTIMCEYSQYGYLTVGILVYLLALTKFIVAYCDGTCRNGIGGLKRNEIVIKSAPIALFVPCYTENFSSLRKTINSLASSDYDDDAKLLFIVCDGDLTGAGNEKSTPDLVLDILGYNGARPQPQEYYALGHAERAINRARVYTGYYCLKGHMVRYVVIAKCGRLNESSRPGNRGKRDSQLILMRFFQDLLDDEALMTPLNYELHQNIYYKLNMDPRSIQYVMMVDADTEVMPDALKTLITRGMSDPKTIATCGETRIANEMESSITAIQAYEYYISHHVGKAFESAFGSVTCLPGCFSVYRIKTPLGKPLLVHSELLDEYAVRGDQVNTLHLKNLLHLGEDRFLTTLLLKYFPRRRITFVGGARCFTVVPASFSVLLSQRRRWINSTIHNLWELLQVQGLCGHCLVSMKAVVFMDLVGTIFSPLGLAYFYVILFRMATEGITDYGVFLLAVFFIFYGLQVIVIATRLEFQFIFWMIIFMTIGAPIYGIVMPIYSFWHQDDFAWGLTHKLRGGGKDTHDGHADSSIALDGDVGGEVIECKTLAAFASSDPRFAGAATEKPKPRTRGDEISATAHVQSLPSTTRQVNNIQNEKKPASPLMAIRDAARLNQRQQSTENLLMSPMGASQTSLATPQPVRTTRSSAKRG